MDTFLRAFGRTAKVVEKKEVKENPKEKNEASFQTKSSTSSDQTGDDLFSNLVVSPIPTSSNQQQSSYHHLNEIEDLDVSAPAEVSEKSDDVAPSAFSFMNSCDDVEKPEDTKDDKTNEGDVINDVNESIKQIDQTEGSEAQDSTLNSKFSFIRRDVEGESGRKEPEISPASTKQKKIKKKTRSIKPGFGNVDQPQIYSSPPKPIQITETPTALEVSLEVSSEAPTEEHVKEIVVTGTELISTEKNEISTSELNANFTTPIEKAVADLDIDTITNNSGEDKVIIETVSQNEKVIEDNDNIESLNNEQSLDINKMDESASTLQIEADTQNEEEINEKNSSDSKPTEPFVHYGYYGFELSEEDSMHFKYNSLKNQEEVLRLAKSSLMEKQKQLIEQWKLEHQSEANILLKIDELRELQMQLENDEDYDEAANINQNIMDLKNQCDNNKYQYPLLDTKILNNIYDYKDLCARFENEYKYMLKDYSKILKYFEKKDGEIETSSEKKLNEMTLELKEKKLIIERDRSHVTLDKEHLAKKECVLNEEIEKQTKDLNHDKDQLLEKRAAVQDNIAELLAKLDVLRDEEKQLNTAVSDIDCKIDEIMNDFKPRVESLTKEKDQAIETECSLASKMEQLLVEESEVSSKREEIIVQRKKNQEIVDEIAGNIEVIQTHNESSCRRNEDFLASLDFDGLKFDSNSELLKEKDHLKKMTNELEELQKQVLCDEGEEKRIQRSLKDIEAQLAELQQIKQVHVKERKYKDAKTVSDDIKTLTAKGEQISNDGMKLIENIKIKKKKIHSLSLEISSEEEIMNKKEFSHDQIIIEKLVSMNDAITIILDGQPEKFIAELLSLQYSNNSTIINDLSSKHGVHIKTESTDVQQSEEIDADDLIKELEDLEESLKLAEVEENWDRAEEINLEIENKKKLLENT